MTRSKKADLRGAGSKTNFTGGEIKAFSNRKYNPYWKTVQCRFCGSDYMRYAVNGYCQRCQQRAEFVLRDGRNGAARNEQRRQV